MKRNISFPGLLSGAGTAVLAALLLSQYSMVWLIVGVALGMALGAALARPGPERAPEKTR